MRKTNKKIKLRELCSKNITRFNYDADTDELASMIYRYCDVDLNRTNAIDVLYGTKDVPKLASVMRAVQIRKKLVKNEVDGVVV